MRRGKRPGSSDENGGRNGHPSRGSGWLATYDPLPPHGAPSAVRPPSSAALRKGDARRRVAFPECPPYGRPCSSLPWRRALPRTFATESALPSAARPPAVTARPARPIGLRLWPCPTRRGPRFRLRGRCGGNGRSGCGRSGAEAGAPFDRAGGRKHGPALAVSLHCTAHPHVSNDHRFDPRVKLGSVDSRAKR